MFPIVKKEVYSPVTYMMEIEATDVAKVAQPGHFVMVKNGEFGERIPLTVADFDREKGTITLVVQAVGKTTEEMMELNEGDSVDDFVGPLGLESHITPKKKVVLVGGGLGVAPVFPQLRRFKELGAHTISIIGFRNKDLIFWKDKFDAYSDELIITTDDGSFGRKGFVSDALKDVLTEQKDVEEVVAIGPVIMMKVCSDTSRPFGVKTMVSLNSIMVDGTGMCGSCRVTIDGKVKFACIDGPDFDGHLVDWDELMLRQNRFRREEGLSLEQWHEQCNLMKQADEKANQ